MATSNDCDAAIVCPKIRQIEFDDEIHLVACAGHEGPSMLFEEWYEFGDWDADPIEISEGEEFTAVILTPGGLFVADRFLRPYKIESRFYAAGTGGPFAWAVLAAGCGVAKAMETAIALDPNSDFGYDVEYLADVNA